MNILNLFWNECLSYFRYNLLFEDLCLCSFEFRIWICIRFTWNYWYLAGMFIQISKLLTLLELERSRLLPFSKVNPTRSVAFYKKKGRQFSVVFSDSKGQFCSTDLTILYRESRWHRIFWNYFEYCYWLLCVNIVYSYISNILEIIDATDRLPLN